MWKLKIGWDDKLPPLQAGYLKMVKIFFQHQPSSCARCYKNFNKDVIAYEVHIFSDASEFF